mmetsp:Transcript_36057/g.95761  ORF Transcript_36057/g.95761 Transcript_36057/m.95761 type:complete len:222 (+) Transcript_36057:961-1626(+)
MCVFRAIASTSFGATSLVFGSPCECVGDGICTLEKSNTVSVGSFKWARCTIQIIHHCKFLLLFGSISARSEGSSTAMILGVGSMRLSLLNFLFSTAKIARRAAFISSCRTFGLFSRSALLSLSSANCIARSMHSSVSSFSKTNCSTDTRVLMHSGTRPSLARSPANFTEDKMVLKCPARGVSPKIFRNTSRSLRMDDIKSRACSTTCRNSISALGSFTRLP